MADYRMYSLDEFGKISYAEYISAPTDVAAIALAREIRPDSRKSEIWQGRRLVATVAASGFIQLDA